MILPSAFVKLSLRKVRLSHQNEIFIPRWEIKIIFMILPSVFVKLSLRKVRLSHQNEIFHDLIFTTSRSIFFIKNSIFSFSARI